MYERLIRPLLFLLPAERAHNWTKKMLSVEAPWRAFARRYEVVDPRLETSVGGLRLRSPIGLAPGFDKDVEALPGLGHLGFGYITVGTIMPEPREGNPPPRLIRRAHETALMNSLGLPSRGLDHAIRKLRRYRASHPGSGPVIIGNIGGLTIEQVLASHRAIEPFVDATEVDMICPNVRDWGEVDRLENIARLVEKLGVLRRKPLFLKLPIRSSEENWEKALAMAGMAAANGLEGISIGGGILVEDSRLAVGRGNLTGRPIFDHALKIIRDLRSALGERLAIKVAGGVFDGDKAFAFLENGASLVDILTSFVYLGPSAAARINRGLLKRMCEEGVISVQDIQARRPRGLTGEKDFEATNVG